MKGKIVTLQEAAAITGRSQTTIKAWIGRGMPATRDERGRTWQIDIGRMLTWREQQAASRPAGGGDDDPAISFEEARRRRQVIALEAEQLDLAVRKGEVAPIADIFEHVMKMQSTLRTKLIAWPTNLAPIVAAESDPRKCFSILTEAVHRALREWVAEFQSVCDREIAGRDRKVKAAS